MALAMNATTNVATAVVATPAIAGALSYKQATSVRFTTGKQLQPPYFSLGFISNHMKPPLRLCRNVFISFFLKKCGQSVPFVCVY